MLSLNLLLLASAANCASLTLSDDGHQAVSRRQTPSTTSVSISPYLFSPLIAQKVYDTALAFNGMSPQYPQYTTGGAGQWKFFSPNTWTSGFFPAILYEMNTRSQLCPESSKVNGSNVMWLEFGREESAGIIGISKNNTVRHDVGFMSFAFQEELIVNSSNETARNAINDFASELAARYSTVVGCTRSWDSANPDQFQVIIDNMINLQVLFASADLTKSQTLRYMAMSHADNTMKNHVRADGSSFHVVDYNATTGGVIDQRTSQGYSNSSTWSRGQSWGILGFAMMYQYTNVSRYLETSRRMATYFLDHTPVSGIIPWDFNAPGDPPPADSSAAMIASNGYLLLSSLEAVTGNSSGSVIWENAAIALLNSTTNFAWNSSSQSLLANGTVNNRANPANNDAGTIYGDYYFIKAGNLLLQRGLASCN